MIISFLTAAQVVEAMIDGMRRGGHKDREVADAAIHGAWLAKKVAELSCSSVFAQAAHDYATVLEAYVWDETVDRWSPELRDRRSEMLDAARADLGNRDTALERHRDLGRASTGGHSLADR